MVYTENKAIDALLRQMGFGELGAISISPIWVDFNVVDGGWRFMAESQKPAIKIWRMA